MAYVCEGTFERIHFFISELYLKQQRTQQQASKYRISQNKTEKNIENNK